MVQEDLHALEHALGKASAVHNQILELIRRVKAGMEGDHIVKELEMIDFSMRLRCADVTGIVKRMQGL